MRGLETAVAFTRHRGFESNTLRRYQRTPAPGLLVCRPGAGAGGQSPMRLCAARTGAVRLAVPNACPGRPPGPSALVALLRRPGCLVNAAAGLVLLPGDALRVHP